MKRLILSLILNVLIGSLYAQTFSLPGDGNWYRIATMGGAHSHIEYTYSQSTAHNPSISIGELNFINATNFTIQYHQTMGYQAWNQPQFALLNLGNGSELWVKATNGVLNGNFTITRITAGTAALGDLSDNNLADNGGTLTIYNKLADNAHTYFGNVVLPQDRMAIGTGYIDPTYHLAVKGKVHAQEIVVDTQNWPDYVFDPTYVLPTLDSVNRFIQKNHHLPGIPSATDVSTNGLSLGELNKSLTEKVEQLTLYLLEENKQRKEQDKEIAELRRLLNEQGQHIKKLR